MSGLFLDELIEKIRNEEHLNDNIEIIHEGKKMGINVPPRPRPKAPNFQGFARKIYEIDVNNEPQTLPSKQELDRLINLLVNIQKVKNEIQKMNMIAPYNAQGVEARMRYIKDIESEIDIMGYAGICNPNVQNNSDDYFHGENIKEMWANIFSGNSSTCFAGSATNNVAPVANAGSDYSIPRSTAFVLRGSSTDADTATGITYCWEQTDSGAVTSGSFGSTLVSGSMNRSLPPTTSPDRYIPNVNRVIAGQLTETNPTVPVGYDFYINGVQVVQELTQHERTKVIPILYLSAEIFKLVYILRYTYDDLEFLSMRLIHPKFSVWN